MMPDPNFFDHQHEKEEYIELKGDQEELLRHSLIALYELVGDTDKVVHQLIAKAFSEMNGEFDRRRVDRIVNAAEYFKRKY